MSVNVTETAKEKVLKKWPRAFCYKGHPKLRCIFASFKGILAVNNLSGWQDNEASAWEAASKKRKRK